MSPSHSQIEAALPKAPAPVKANVLRGTSHKGLGENSDGFKSVLAGKCVVHDPTAGAKSDGSRKEDEPADPTLLMWSAIFQTQVTTVAVPEDPQVITPTLSTSPVSELDSGQTVVENGAPASQSAAGVVGEPQAKPSLQALSTIAFETATGTPTAALSTQTQKTGDKTLPKASRQEAKFQNILRGEEVVPGKDLPPVVGAQFVVPAVSSPQDLKSLGAALTGGQVKSASGSVLPEQATITPVAIQSVGVPVKEAGKLNSEKPTLGDGGLAVAAPIPLPLTTLEPATQAPKSQADVNQPLKTLVSLKSDLKVQSSLSSVERSISNQDTQTKELRETEDAQIQRPRLTATRDEEIPAPDTIPVPIPLPSPVPSSNTHSVQINFSEEPTMLPPLAAPPPSIPLEAKAVGRSPELPPSPRTSEFPALPQTPPSQLKVISIRIPLSDVGGIAKHMDLTFQNRNSDLTLEFNSPSRDIQRRIQESMPSLLEKLETVNWTSTKPEPAGASSEMPAAAARRNETTDSHFIRQETSKDISLANTSSQQGFRFDENAQGRKEGNPQNPANRNRKKDAAWDQTFEDSTIPKEQS